jgi:hypothetical protein
MDLVCLQPIVLVNARLVYLQAQTYNWSKSCVNARQGLFSTCGKFTFGHKVTQGVTGQEELPCRFQLTANGLPSIADVWE